MTSVPAGWYPDTQTPGQQRYWDGEKWTEHFAPMGPQPPAHGSQPLAQGAQAVSPGPEPKMKRSTGKIIMGVLGALVVIIILATALGGGGGSTGSDESSASDETSAAVDPSLADSESSAPKPSYTTAQENAIRAAKQYLDLGSGFSRRGLIEQLSSPAGNDFPRADAVFAVNHIKIDYKEQAVQSAKGYMDLSGFSRNGLIEQLTSNAGSKYTQEQAEYAADQVGLK